MYRSCQTIDQCWRTLKGKRNDGSNALHDSARGGHVSITSELLKAGTQVNARRNDGTTALHRCDGTEIVQLLLRNGAETEIRSSTKSALTDHARSRLISSILQSSHSTGVTSSGANLENNTICDQNMKFDVDIPDLPFGSTSSPLNVGPRTVHPDEPSPEHYVSCERDNILQIIMAEAPSPHSKGPRDSRLACPVFTLQC